MNEDRPPIQRAQGAQRASVWNRVESPLADAQTWPVGTIYKVIWQFEPGDITSVYDVWAGSINPETDGFAGHCIASYSTAAEAYRLAERLNNHHPID